MNDKTPIKANDLIKVGFTWYAVTSVQGDTIYAAQPGRAPHRFTRDQVREVDPR